MKLNKEEKLILSNGKKLSLTHLNRKVFFPKKIKNLSHYKSLNKYQDPNLIKIFYNSRLYKCIQNNIIWLYTNTCEDKKILFICLQFLTTCDVRIVLQTSFVIKNLGRYIIYSFAVYIFFYFQFCFFVS